MSTWRRHLVATTVLLIGLGLVAPSAWGQDQGDLAPSGQPDAGDQVVHSWALAPAGSADPGGAGNRPNLSYEADPGAVLEDGITLFNYSNVQLTFAIYATDAFNNAAGEFDLLPTGEAPEDVGSWITLPQENVTVPAQAQVTMPITIKIPADATAGDHAGAILASSPTQSTGPDGKIVTLDRRTGSRVYIRVAGPLEPELAIESVKTTYKPALNPLDGSADVTYRIQNRGNVRLGGAHRVSISGPFGTFTKRVPAEDLTELLPGEGVTLHATFEDMPATALAFTTVRLEPSSGGGAQELSAVSRRGTGLAPPITLIVLTLAGWLALRSRQAYRGHRRDERQLAAQPT